MMFVASPLNSDPTSPIPAAHSPTPAAQSAGPGYAPLPPSSPPCWASQALCDLAQAETELHCLQERHATEIETVKRGVERAVLGARREEQRLLERVEQDHRDAQQHLEQVQRENTAAARISQSLLDQRLRKLMQLREQIQSNAQCSSLEQSGPSLNLLLKGVAEFLQPWEISLSLKKVSFKPSSQPNAVTFGDIRVQEHSVSLPVGGCGPHGQLCALHSGEMQCGHMSQSVREQRGTLDGPRPARVLSSPTGRVVRKIRLSARSDEESVEELQLLSPKMHHWSPKCEQSDRELSQDDEMELPASKSQGEDLFLAVHAVLKNGNTEGKEQGMSSEGRCYYPRNQGKPHTVALLSSQESPPSPEQGRQEHVKLSQCLSLDSQDGDSGRVSQNSSWGVSRYSHGAPTSPRMTPREALASQSCLDLTSRGRPYSCLSQSSDDHLLMTPGDSGRAPSPADSLDSCYTFIVSSPRDHSISKGSLNYNSRLSKSAVDLTRKTRPLISGAKNEHVGVWRVKHSSLHSTQASSTSTPLTLLSRGLRVSDTGETPSYRVHRSPIVQPQLQKRTIVATPNRPMVPRSLSMSVIDMDRDMEPNRGRGEKGEPTLMEMEEEGDMSFPLLHTGGGNLVRQFGKQGSGRADLTLPSGIHATPQGQLFIVDCGNARVQVTDPQGNVLQQVTSPTSEGSARRCRNYFDIAVNAKGLIALSCAAERALLVFNRHGRLLQTFGGSGLGSTKSDLEAPRGVTVTRLDEFLVADIRKGTLIALKLDPKTGSRLERTVVTGFHRPYLVAACLSSGMVAVSERGSETGCKPCVKVLEPGWNTVRVLGVCSAMGPVLACPWGICIDRDGNVLVADWGEQHKVMLYPAQGMGWPIVTQGLSSPRGLALLPEGYLVVSDSMHHCIKIYQYK